MMGDSKKTTLHVALALSSLLAPAALAQTTPTPPVPGAGQSGGTVLDRIVAVVNGDLVLESDVNEEQRFAAFQPLTDPEASFSRPRAVERLINRDLILQQLKIQPQAPVTDKEVDDQLGQLRKDIPACKAAHCETDEGWQRFIAAQGFTVDQLHERWKQRMEVLRFIEQRFRMGVRITPAEIQSYYDKTLLPQYAQRNAKPPKVEAVSDRIQEILLQQQVGSLLGDWLKSLRAQGTVQILGQDEAPGR
jgi:peptidyl-prolyl cis-trans isomerase SurA